MRRLKSSYTIVPCIIQYTFMLLLEAVGPGGSLSSVLAGGNGNIRRQLRPDDRGACPSAVGSVGGGNGTRAAILALHWPSNSVLYSFFS